MMQALQKNQINHHRCRIMLGVVVLGLLPLTLGGVAPAQAQAPFLPDTASLPGPAIIPPQEAAQIFRSVCLDTDARPVADMVAASFGLVSPEGQDSFFHPAYNFSVNTAGTHCSVMFAPGPMGHGEAAHAFRTARPIMMSGRASEVETHRFSAPGEDGTVHPFTLAGVAVDWGQ